MARFWLRKHALLVPGDDSEIPVCSNDADGTLNVGDDNTGYVVSMQPDGNLAIRENGSRGDWELVTRDDTINTMNFRSGQNVVPEGIPFKVPYRAR